MSVVQLLPGSIVSPGALPSYAGQDFVFMAEGPVAKFSGEQHQRDSSLGPGYLTTLTPNYAGDAFEGAIDLHPYPYGDRTVTGFFGPGQEESGDTTLGMGYSVAFPPSLTLLEITPH